jgi:hypothetical protein
MRRFLLAFLLLLSIAGLSARTLKADQLVGWPSLSAQLSKDHVIPGSALERLVAANQDFSLLRATEAKDQLRIPLWLRVIWRKAHPEETYSAQDPTGGYPLVLNEVHEWMLSHQDLQPGTPGKTTSTRAASETGEERISGAQSSARSESDIRINFFDPTKVIAASNNISASGMQAMFFSTNSGATWGQTSLPLVTGDAFHSDPTVEWTSDGTAWSTTIGINSAGTVLHMRSYKSTNNGATWTFDNTFSGSQTSTDKQFIWADHSTTSSFKDNLYAIWHNGNPVYMNRRTGPTGAWQTPIQVSGSETTGTGIGADVKTNSGGDLFGFWPDTGSQGIYVVKSTNGGVSYGAATRIATTFGSFQISVPAMASRIPLIYTSASAYKSGTTNNVYVSWTDMTGASGCTTPSNAPGSNTASTCKTRIWFSRSTTGGTSWSTPVMLNNQASKNDQFAQALTVDDTTGKISVIYYDTVNDTNRLKTNLFYQSSDDAGVTWSAPFQVTTAQTDETSAGADSGNQYGDYNSLSGRGGIFFPSWTDRRSGASEEIWTAAISDTGTGTPAFTLAASPTAVSITQGSAGSSTISTTVSGGFNSAVALSATGQPSGVTVAFSPTSIAAPGSGSSTMTITVASTATAGTSTITVTGTGGGLTHTATVALTVTTAGTPAFTIAAAPTAVSIAKGSAGSSTISTTVSGGFNSAISLSATGQPSGVTVAFSPTSIAAPGSGSSTMTITVASTATAGTSTITVTGTGGGLTHTATVALTVTGGTVTQLLGNPGFENGSSSPAPWTVTAGVIDSSTGEPAHSGTWKAWLNGYGTTHTDSILQTVTIPSTVTTATLAFWLHIDTAETTTTTAFDTLKVQIRNTSGTVLSTLATYSNLNHNTGYAQKSFDVSSFKGQTVQVFLVGTEDSSLQTSFVVDDFTLNVQ